MKAFFKIMIVTLVASTTGLAAAASQSSSHQNSSAQVQNVSLQDSSISVFLPRDANVTLKNGNSMSGKLTAIDPQGELIELELSGESATVEIAEIEEVRFRGEVSLRSGGEIVIRGDEDETFPSNNQKTWNEPLTNFKVIDSSRGEAQIQLTSLSKLELRGIRSVVANSSYVVDEIKFNDLGKINLTATPRR